MRQTLPFARGPLAALAVCASLVGDAGASAPPGRFTNPTANTVYDTVSHLTWQETVGDTAVTWSAASSYCAGLSVDTYTSGWRLPAIKELLTIVDYSENNPAIDQTVFPNTPSDYYWTDTCYPAGSPPCTSYAWDVNVFAGGTVDYNAVMYGFQVRCVR